MDTATVGCPEEYAPAALTPPAFSMMTEAKELPPKTLSGVYWSSIRTDGW